jgi:signal transduction histidine kinase
MVLVKPDLIDFELADLLKSQSEDIITAIINSYDRFHPNSSLAELPMKERRDWTRYEVNRMINILISGLPGSETGPKYSTADNLVERGWGFPEVIEIYFFVNKDAILPFIWERFASEPEKLQSAILQFDLCLLRYLTAITRSYADEINRRLLEKREHIAQMEERFRLAREIHDNLSQALGIIILKVSMAIDIVDNQRFDDIKPCLIDLKEVALSAYTESREALLGLRTDIQNSTDFFILLENFLTRYQRSFGIEIKYHFDEGLVDLPIKIATQLFCIIQEALANIRKHADTKNGCLMIHSESGGIEVIIQDYGKGFNSEKTEQENQQGIGLQVMKERTESVGGKFDIQSIVGQGTTIKIWLPVNII